LNIELCNSINSKVANETISSSKFNSSKRRYLSGFIFEKIASRNEIGNKV